MTWAHWWRWPIPNGRHWPARTDAGAFCWRVGRARRFPKATLWPELSALAVAHLDATPGTWARAAGSAEGRIFLAAPLDRAALEARAEAADVVRWDSRTGTLIAERQQRVGALILSSQPLRDLPAGARAGALAGAIRAEGLHLLTFSPEAAQLRARAESVRHWRPGEDWPDLSDSALLDTLETWLGPYFGSARSRDDLGRLNLLPALQALLPWPLPAQLDDIGPHTSDRSHRKPHPAGIPPRRRADSGREIAGVVWAGAHAHRQRGPNARAAAPAFARRTARTGHAGSALVLEFQLL